MMLRSKFPAATLADCLDSLTASMFLVAGMRTIVYANRSGHDMLASGDVLCAVDGCLIATDLLSDQALEEVLAAAGNGDPAVSIRGIAQSLVGRRDGERYVVHVMPLTSGAVLFVHKVAFRPPSAPEVIANTYKLTPTELRVLLGIVQVGVAKTAEALGIAESTVKTHLRRVFDKTGARRQVELVKLVAGFSNSPVHY